MRRATLFHGNIALTAMFVMTSLAFGCVTTAPPTAIVHHIVLCWLKEPGNETQRRQLIAASRSFEQIPGVLSVSAGTSVPSSRLTDDSSFDVGIIVTVRNREALSAYQAHPLHRQAVTNILMPAVRRIQVYDVRAE